MLLAPLLLVACGDEADCTRGKGDAETRVLQLNDLNGLKVNGSSKVYVSYGPQQQVVVKAQPNVLDALNRDVLNGVWEVETNRCFRSHKTIEVYITVPDFTYAEMNGSGEIVLHDRFETNEFRTLESGSGKIKANFTAKRAITQLTGSGRVELSGLAEQQHASVTGSGQVQSFGLETERAIIQISGSGDVEVSVSDLLEASISGSGKVYYKGSPTVTSQITGSGKVEKR
ncbi:head GIN domain-containing protein [Pontibacter beigongshangensis]|uniref:head GIN domain-containing protein n=1 Tax=Pontibacter beigongshangensis TaxID=2574733 RepID=UPI001F50BC47|nr:head GIN domain-containing protein [Pontibacter beigongshangensis]